ncbi:MAG: hypothetical protein JW741_04575 [Sedimentisphaerales bacterium]|nr:hypothetical protein [Sedimentisphaerales bacterium]
MSAGGGTFLWGLLVVLLYFAGTVSGGFVTVDGPINDPPSDGYYWISGGATVDLYASGSYQVYIDGGSTVVFKSGASAGGVSAYVGSALTMEGGTVSGTITAQGGVALTLVGTYGSFTTTLGTGHYDASLNQLVADDATNGWNGDLTFTYEGDTGTTTLTFSTFSNIVFDGGGSGGENTEPLAYAGEDVSIFTSEQPITLLSGTATDADGDAMTYRWLEGTTEVKPWTPVPGDGVVTLDLSALAQIYLPGVYSELHVLTLEVDDGTDVGTDLMDLSVFNTPPSVEPASTSLVVNPGDPISIGAAVADFDGDSVAYEWRQGTTVLASGSASPPAGGDPVGVDALTGTGGTAPFALGINYLTIAADDGVNPVPAEVLVTVEVLDTEAPTLAPDPSTTMLWPPNRQMRAVTIEANAADNSGGAVTLDVEVTSNEPDPDDWIIDSVDSETGVIELQLRAERSTSGDGRVYTVTITATDEASNSSTAAVEICVPHDNRRQK